MKNVEDQNGQDRKYKIRSSGDYLKLNRWISANHFRTEKTKEGGRDGATFRLSDFFSRKIFSWFFFYIQSRFGPNHRYDTYLSGDRGVHNLKEGQPVSIGIAGDWGTFTTESIAIGEKIKEKKPDYTVHIGDTYFVGAPHEIENNFILHRSPWPRGSEGSFALLGNHEMYARGIAYYDKLLPTLGIKDQHGNSSGQGAAFFCLQNDHWRILGLDTGYHSIGKVPILEMIPFFAPDCRFPDQMLDWLDTVVKLSDPFDKRALLILTHHQPLSAFKKEDEYLVPAEQLGKRLGADRPVLWLWAMSISLLSTKKQKWRDAP